MQSAGRSPGIFSLAACSGGARESAPAAAFTHRAGLRSAATSLGLIARQGTFLKRTRSLLLRKASTTVLAVKGRSALRPGRLRAVAKIPPHIEKGALRECDEKRHFRDRPTHPRQMELLPNATFHDSSMTGKSRSCHIASSTHGFSIKKHDKTHGFHR